MTTFTHLEHKLADRLGFSRDEMVNRRKQLTEGVDWVRVGRWWKYSDAGVAKLQAKLQVEIPPPKPDPMWMDAEVVRANFPNPHIISAKLLPSGEVKVTRISPLWRQLFVPRMRIKVKPDGNLLTTRKPRKKGWF